MDYSSRGNLQQLFVDKLTDCSLVLLDIDGRVLTWNAGASQLYGHVESEVAGRHFSCFYVQEDIDAGHPALFLANALANGRHECTGRRLRKDGTEVRVEDVLMPLYDPLNHLVAFGNLTRPANRGLQSATGLRTSIPTGAAHRKVLLVDDDEAVRLTAVRLLESLGYDVLVASSGLEALDLLGGSADIDVLFTDVIMPDGMSGGELAEQARRVRPGLKIVFASGYFEGALVRDGNLEASTHFLVKPYRKKDLSAKMSEVLAS